MISFRGHLCSCGWWGRQDPGDRPSQTAAQGRLRIKEHPPFSPQPVGQDHSPGTAREERAAGQCFPGLAPLIQVKPGASKAQHHQPSSTWLLPWLISYSWVTQSLKAMGHSAPGPLVWLTFLSCGPWQTAGAEVYTLGWEEGPFAGWVLCSCGSGHTHRPASTPTEAAALFQPLLPRGGQGLRCAGGTDCSQAATFQLHRSGSKRMPWENYFFNFNKQ